MLLDYPKAFGTVNDRRFVKNIGSSGRHERKCLVKLGERNQWQPSRLSLGAAVIFYLRNRLARRTWIIPACIC